MNEHDRATCPQAADDSTTPTAEEGQRVAARAGLPGRGAAPPTAAVAIWICPHCGSPALRVACDERRSCRVTTSVDAGVDTDPSGQVLPWPSYEDDEFVDIDPASFAYSCDVCFADDVTPRRRGGHAVSVSPPPAPES